MGDPVAIVGATLQSLNVLIRLLEDGVKILTNSMGAVGMEPINESLEQTLIDDFTKLTERITKIRNLYSKHKNRCDECVHTKVDKLLATLHQFNVQKIIPSKKAKIAYDLFGTQINEKIYDMLQNLCSKLNCEAEIIEDLLNHLKIRVVHPKHTSKVIDPETIHMTSCDTKLNVTWKDEKEQFEFTKKYRLEISDLSEITPQYVDITVEDIVAETHTNHMNLSVAIDNLDPSTYSVRIRKILKDDQVSDWSSPNSEVTIRKVHRHLVSPRVSDEPFKSPSKNRFTISLLRPQDYTSLNIVECKVIAASNDPSRVTYNKSIPVIFSDDNDVYDLPCTEFTMTDKECVFRLLYVDNQGRSSQDYLKLKQKIGSLIPSRVNQLDINPVNPFNLKVTWSHPEDNNAGAVDKYVVECHEIQENQSNRSYKPFKNMRFVTSDHDTKEEGVTLDGIHNDKQYRIFLYSINYNDTKSVSCCEVYPKTT